uniref:Uncharacterized protein n=1 Tax=Rhizophora mucronata TaxID=61149 RepID=A0A2P2QMQ0_RHIMU
MYLSIATSINQLKVFKLVNTGILAISLFKFQVIL